MPGPLPLGTRVRVLAPWSGYESDPSEATTIAAVQYVTAEGEVVDEPQPDWQYVLDGDEPFADTAFRPEYLEPA